jgi:hypothetical protein
MKNQHEGMNLPPKKGGEQPESVEKSLKEEVNNVKSFFQMFNADKPDLNKEIDTIKRKMNNLRLTTEQTTEPISPETKIFLTKLEALIDYFIFLAEKNPIIKKGLLSGGVSARRDSIAELSKYIFELMDNTEIE